MSAVPVTTLSARAGKARDKSLRLDVQALRAVAVLGVVVYHLFSGLLPGGFVGVDVFFVISGFLITTHLISSPPRRAGDFAKFWARRILRLIPPVGVVLLFTLLGILLFVSTGQWKQLAREAGASMLYVENWQLIGDATDYLNAHKAPSPFQHFWSLSVEEQYYIFWPFLVAAIAYVARKASAHARQLAYVGGFTLAVAISLGVSIAQTASSPESAYFSTWTRVWELGIGSALAALYPVVAGRLAVGARLGLLWVGIAGITVSYLTIDASTPFPGTIALLPTVSVALVILANDPAHPANPRLLTHSTPVQRVGDWSYALYLWHWPLITLAPEALGHPLDHAHKVVVFALAIVVSWASTRLLETPIRGSAFLRGRTRRVYALGAVVSLVVIAACGAVTVDVDRRVAADQRALDEAKGSTGACLAAGAMDPANDCESSTALITSPAFAKADVSAGIKGCLNWPPFKKGLVSCSRGDTLTPTRRIALFGNSHAGQWLEAISAVATAKHWRVDSYIIGACHSTAGRQQEKACTDITQQAMDRMTSGSYDLVVYATYDPDPSLTPADFASTIDVFTEAGSDVLVIRDTPAPWDPNNYPADCIADHPADFDACAGTPAKWIQPDRLYDVAKKSKNPKVSTVDVNDLMCDKSSCPAVIGGVIVFSDYNHLSKTFSTSLAPYLEPALAKAVGAPAS